MYLKLLELFFFLVTDIVHNFPMVRCLFLTNFTSWMLPVSCQIKLWLNFECKLYTNSQFSLEFGSKRGSHPKLRLEQNVDILTHRTKNILSSFNFQLP